MIFKEKGKIFDTVDIFFLTEKKIERRDVRVHNEVLDNEKRFSLMIIVSFFNRIKRNVFDDVPLSQRFPTLKRTLLIKPIFWKTDQEI